MEGSTTITALDFARSREMRQRIEDGEIEVHFKGNLDMDCYVQWAYTTPDGKVQLCYAPHLVASEPYFMVAPDFPLAVIPGRDSVKCFKIEMEGLPYMICEDVPALERGLSSFLGEYNEWQDLEVGAKLTISVVSMSRKEISELEDWEPD